MTQFQPQLPACCHVGNMHWTYKEASDQDDRSLEQGDLLAKTPELERILQKYHPYYASHEDNNFFMVVTQSCDLVRRPGASCKSRYISLAPARTVKAVLKREFDDKLFNIELGAQAFASSKTRGAIEQFLERLYNNNEPSFFYFEENLTAGVSEPLCGLLSLTISIKEEHYQTCFAARVLSVKDEFQAKVGWLVGQLYSRVGTRDWPSTEMRTKVVASSEKYAVWVNDADVNELNSLCEQTKKSSPGKIIESADLAGLIKKIPKRKESAINCIIDAATKIGIFLPATERDSERFKFRKELENDVKFSIFFK
jgi:hypothetical protein